MDSQAPPLPAMMNRSERPARGVMGVLPAQLVRDESARMEAVDNLGRPRSPWVGSRHTPAPAVPDGGPPPPLGRRRRADQSMRGGMLRARAMRVSERLPV